MAVEYIKHRPKHYFHPFGFAVCYQLRQIKFGNNGQHIPALRIIPSFIQHNKLQSVPAGEIDIIFIRIHVDTGFKRHSFQIPVIPPIPCHFACLYPWGITDTVGRSQSIDQVVDRHIRILLRNGQHTPRIGTGATATGYKIGSFSYIFLLPPRIKVCFSRIRSKDTFQSILSLLWLHKHARISFEVGLQQGQFYAAAIHGNRKKSQFRLCFWQRSDVIYILISHRHRFFIIGGIRKISRIIFLKIKLGLFLLYNDIRRLCGIESIGDSLIVCTEDDSEPAFQLQVEFVTCCNELLETVKRWFYVILYLSPSFPCDTGSFTYYSSVFQNQTYIRVWENCIISMHHLVGQFVSGADFHFQCSIGWREYIFLFLGCKWSISNQ